MFSIFIERLRGEGNYGKKFESFVKWFLTTDPEWSSLVSQVWLWDDWPSRWGPDCGIDLIFKDRNGQTWAVQAKCYDPAYSITKRDIDSFLSESNRQSIDQRLLIATTDRVASNGMRAIIGQEKPVTLFLRRDFDQAPVNYPYSYSDLHAGKRKTKPLPRKHQSIAVEAVVNGFKTHTRGQLIMACGTGKTFTTLWVKEQLNSELTLVLLPSLSLLAQTMKEWAWSSSCKINILNVCSDNSISKAVDDIPLIEAHCPVTNDVEFIRTFMNNPGPKVVFCTYQSSPLIAEAQKDMGVASFDLVIADEAHRCAGHSDSAFTTVLKQTKIRSQRRLFTTATPRIYSKKLKSIAAKNDLEVIGMDDEAKFGPVFHHLSFGSAIEQDLLTDYQVLVVGVTEKSIREAIEKNQLLKLSCDNIVDTQSLAIRAALLQAIDKYALTRLITFHSRVKSAKWFAQQLTDSVVDGLLSSQASLRIFSDYVSGKMQTSVRKAKIDTLAQLPGYDVGILSNSRCLSEGVDVPSLDAIAFVDSKSSQVDIIQSVGRAIRKSQGKELGLIIVPLFVDLKADVEKTFDSSKFKPIWDVVNALKSHDSKLSELIDAYRRDLGKNTYISDDRLGNKVVFDLPEEVPKNYFKSLELKLVETCSESWEFYFGLLERYVEDNRDCYISKRYIDPKTNIPLGSWSNTQRVLQKKGLLSAERTERLKELGFIWNIRDHVWEQSFEKLKQTLKTMSIDSVIQTTQTPDGFNIGLWVSEQRKAYNKGVLSPKRRKKLEDFGFIWDPGKWNTNRKLKSLKQYIEVNHSNPPESYTDPDGLEIGNWIGNLRQRNRNGNLPSDLKESLDSIGFQWTVFERTPDESWDIHLTALRKFLKKKNIEELSPTYVDSSGISIGKWVLYIRRRKQHLEAEKISELDTLGFIWNLADFEWDKKISKLLDYKAKYGDLNPPASFVTKSGFKLGSWVSDMRKAKRNNERGQLSIEREEQLNELGFIWDAIIYSKEQNVDELIQLSDEHDSITFAKSHYVSPSGKKLGRFLRKVKKGETVLPDYLIARLRAKGFDV